MATKTQNELARQVMQYLAGKFGYVQTTDIVVAMNLKDNAHNRMAVIAVLNELCDKGIVSKTGKKKYGWKAIRSDYDHVNPLATDRVLPPIAYSAALENKIIKYLKDQPYYHWEVTYGITRHLGYDADDSYHFDAVHKTLVDMHSRSLLEKTHDEGVSVAWRLIQKEGDAPAETAVVPTNDEIAQLKAEVSRLRYETTELQGAMIEVADSNERLSREINELRSVIGQTQVIEIKSPDTATVTLDEPVPAIFEKVLSLAAARRNILLIGPAGCGKTTVARLIAKALNLSFGAIACTAGMSETHLLGKCRPNTVGGEDKFQSTDFLSAYEEGGVFLLDELDAADANLLLALNSALANGYASVPSRPGDSRARKHQDFVCIATANTFGRGANRTYAGRTQLDEATIDRFRIGMIECNYDRGIEMRVCPHTELREKLWAIRNKIEAAGLRRVMSTRFMVDAYVMMTVGGWKIGDVLASYFSGWSEEEMNKVK